MSKHVTHCTWDEVPHLSDGVKADLWASIPEYQREARAEGKPQLGAGAIYPIPERDIVVPPFKIPDHWPRVYGMDVGWKRTAAIWGAKDIDGEIGGHHTAGTVYLYAEHYRGKAEPVIHAEAIKKQGDWIPGVIDPAARGRAQRDGVQLMKVYRDLGLDIQIARNAVESGIYICWTALSGGGLKVFENCQNWRQEYRLYRRDIDGKVVKERDHLMDCTRYLMISGQERMRAVPVPVEQVTKYREVGREDTGWMA